ncbi:hypothetical protein [Daejeonella sp.]|uniref:hypothetical protein n=1 Tax=Daejeonella sp. TaxID=2805397 RepID=UPI0030C155DE
MSDSIFVLGDDGALHEMRESQYLTEDDFQVLLAKYPNLLSGDQINREYPRKWLLVTREMGVPDELNSSNRWSLDHLLLDQDGIPTLVEVKRSSDTRLRREVIGQILDYAANAVTYWSIEDIINQFENNCESQGIIAEDTLRAFLITDTSEHFWEQVQTNLKAGKIRMLIVADTIPKELLRIIEFLNGQMSPAEILGVELKQFISQTNQLKTLVPRVVGQTTLAAQQKSVKHSLINRWDEKLFFGEIAKRHPEHIAKFQRIYDFSKQNFDTIWWGTGSRTGSFIPAITPQNNFFQFFGVYTSGSVEIQFQWIKKKPPFDNTDKRMELLNKLNSIFGLNYKPETIELRPNIKIENFKNDSVFEAFFDLCKWVNENYRSTL